MGGHIMLAGIVFQVFTFTCLYIIVALFTISFFRNRSSLSTDAGQLVSGGKFKIFAAGMFAASVFIFVRCVYRIAELAEGWANDIMRDEVGYIILDGVMVLCAALALTICHPVFFFSTMVSSRKTSSVVEREKGGDQSMDNAVV